MSEERVTMREALRQARGFRLEGQPPQVPEYRKRVNDHIRASGKKNTTVTELDRNGPMFTNEHRPR